MYDTSYADVHTWQRDARSPDDPDGERSPREWAARRLRIEWRITDAAELAARTRREARWCPPVALALAVATAAAFAALLGIPGPARVDAPAAVLLIVAGVGLGFLTLAAGVRGCLALTDTRGALRAHRDAERTLTEHDDAHTAWLLDTEPPAHPIPPAGAFAPSLAPFAAMAHRIAHPPGCACSTPGDRLAANLAAAEAAGFGPYTPHEHATLFDPDPEPPGGHDVDCPSPCTTDHEETP